MAQPIPPSPPGVRGRPAQLDNQLLTYFHANHDRYPPKIP